MILKISPYRIFITTGKRKIFRSSKKAACWNGATNIKNLPAACLVTANTNGGIVSGHRVGHLPTKSGVDLPLIYADYYFIEALMRYKTWYLK